MSTTLDTPASDTGASDSPTRRLEVSPSQRKSGGMAQWVIAIAILAVVLVVVLRWTAGKAAEREALASIDKTTVGRRSFVVSLKEKGELKAANSQQIKCEVEGRTTIISLVPEGIRVEEGDLLVELASDQIDERIQQQELQEAAKQLAYESAVTELEIQRDRNASDIRKAALQIELKQLALEKYEKGDWEQAKKDAEIEIERALITLTRKEEDAEAAAKLHAKEYITDAEYNEAAFNLKRAEWDLEKARLASKVLIEYTDKADRRQRESDVDEAQKEAERTRKNAAAEEAKRVGALEARKKELALTRSQLAKLRTQKEKCTLVAPSPGFVVYGDGSDSRRWFRGGESQIAEGATVYERQVLVTLPDTSTMVASTRIHESKTARIRVGLPVRITVEGLPGEQFSGTVTKIAQLADSQNRWLNPDLKEYETEITLDGAYELLKPGATAHAEIIIEEVKDALAVPSQCLFTKGGQRFVFRAEGKSVEPVRVVLGAIGTDWTEIVEGLEEGDQILLSVTEEHKRLLPDVKPARFTGGPPPGVKAPGGGARGGSGSGQGAGMRRGGGSPREGHRERSKMRPRGGGQSGEQRGRPSKDSEQSRRKGGKPAGTDAENSAGDKTAADHSTQRPPAHSPKSKPARKAP